MMRILKFERAAVRGDLSQLLDIFDQRYESLSKRNQEKLVSSLGNTRSAAAAERLESVLRQDANEMTRMLAANALGKLEQHDHSVDALANALRDDSRMVRSAAIDSLGRLTAEAKAPDIAVSLNDPEPSVRSSAINALAEMRFEQAAARICELLDDETAFVRDRAARALVQIGDSESLDAMREARQHASRIFRVSLDSSIADLERRLRR